MQIKEIMTSSVVTADAQMPVQQIAELMRERNVGSVVLVNDGTPTGIITDRDLAIGVLGEDHDGTAHALDYATAPVITGSQEMSVEEAGELMVNHGIRRLPIVNGGSLTGIVTLDDLIVRTGDVELARSVTSQITRAAMPEFYFHLRGG